MRRLKISLALIAAFSLGACAAFSNHNAPEKVSATPPPASGIVVISTGAAAPCFATSTELLIAPRGSSYFENIVADTDVDNYSIKSDFSDHQGNINVLTLPAGDYEIYPYILNGFVEPIKVRAVEFSMRAGEAVYVGEYFMDVACAFNTEVVLRDRWDRDLNLVRQRNPAFAHVEFVKRLARFDRYILDRTRK